MSKFAKPRTGGAVAQAEIDRVIKGADAVDDPKAADDDGTKQFTMILPTELAGRVDRARKAAGGISRLAWIRMAIAEKLHRDGM